MTAYRFCRTDDVPLLVRAYNHCYAEPTGAESITVEDFRRWRRELDVWCSSCMVALEGNDTIGVLIGAKRAHASFIHTVAVRPEHRRRGHARHMLESLARKMAILEPRLMLAEVPKENDAARRLLEVCGYEAGETLVDWVAEPLKAVEDVDGTAGFLRATEVGWSDLAAACQGALGGPRSWIRADKSLEAIRDALRGLAFVSDARIEAWLLFHGPVGTDKREILAVSAEPGPAREALLVALLRAARATTAATVSLRRCHPREVAAAALEEAGFHAEGELVPYSATAAPG